LELDQPRWTIQTDHPVAFDTPDTTNPWGAANDNSHRPIIPHICKYILGRPKLSFMDLGCSGGGLVYDFLTDGHEALGLEGSTVSLMLGRAEWGTIPNSLKTCDISRDFTVHRDIGSGKSQPFKFDVISSYEVLEHIPESRLPTMLGNIRNHLNPDGFFIGSVTMISDMVNGIEYHQTIQPFEWWVEQFSRVGLRIDTESNFPEWAHSRRPKPGKEAFTKCFMLRHK